MADVTQCGWGQGGILHPDSTRGAEQHAWGISARKLSPSVAWELTRQMGCSGALFHTEKLIISDLRRLKRHNCMQCMLQSGIWATKEILQGQPVD